MWSDDDSAADMAATPNRIAEFRETKGWTQEELADKLGVSKSLVSLWEGGHRQIKMPMAKQLSETLNVDINQLFPSQANNISIAKRMGRPEADPQPPIGGRRDLPVRGYAQGGDHLVMLEHEAARERIERPPYLEGVDTAFAVYMVGMSMFPALRPGWPLYIHPGQPPRPGDYVLIEMNDHDAMVKELIKENSDHIIVREYNPQPRDFTVSKSEIKKLYRVRGAEF